MIKIVPIYPVRRFLPIALLLAATTNFAAPLSAQDPLWEHQQNVQAQQAEERRMNEIATQMNQEIADMQAGDSDRPAYAPNAFVSFPPAAWNEWVKYQQEQNSQEMEDRFGRNPAYQDLLKGVWTYRSSQLGQSPQTCAATFWTRNGGVSFIHAGGKEDYTFLGFFGASIPRPSQPRTIAIDLVQSGEVQHVRALNIQFGSVESMGMVLFKIDRPEVLLGAIEDKQDFAVRFGGAQIAYGAWHSGLMARDEMKSCLRAQGYLKRK